MGWRKPLGGARWGSQRCGRSRAPAHPGSNSSRGIGLANVLAKPSPPGLSLGVCSRAPLACPGGLRGTDPSLSRGWGFPPGRAPCSQPPFEQKLRPGSLLPVLCKVRPRALSWVIIDSDTGLALFCNSQTRCARGRHSRCGDKHHATAASQGSRGPAVGRLRPAVVPMPLEGPQLAALPVPVPALPGAALRAGAQLPLCRCQP